MKPALTVVSLRLPVAGGRQPPTPLAVSREDVLSLVQHGAQLVEVLSPAHFAAGHLPGALNLPLAQLDPHSAARLDRSRPVIVYCRDAESDLSSRAAWRLVSLGFGQVFRYTAGKADWLANGLPVEGAVGLTAGGLARLDVPTCRLHDQLAQLNPILQDERWDLCVVVNDERVVLGQLDRPALAGDPQATAEASMQSGPATIRPSANLEHVGRELRRVGAGSVLVTTAAGQLVGLLVAEDIERHRLTAAAPRAQIGG